MYSVRLQRVFASGFDLFSHMCKSSLVVQVIETPGIMCHVSGSRVVSVTLRWIPNLFMSKISLNEVCLLG